MIDLQEDDHEAARLDATGDTSVAAGCQPHTFKKLVEASHGEKCFHPVGE